ncbi:MAG TPA: PH domain-containing protein [Acidimicrobiales bacterium]|nr:PH domain-containing protein [Acidimicrobiales bacterium]
MGFPAKMLNPGEEVVVDVRPHWKYLFMPALAVTVVLAGCAVALVDGAPRWALLALAAVLVICLIWLAGRYLKWTTTTLVVTNERLVMRKGVLRRSGREILLDRLTDISYTQSLWDRALGCGDVLLESPGRDSPEVFPDLPHPVAIQNEIYRLINLRRAGPSLAGAGGYVGAGGHPPAPVPSGEVGTEPAGTWAFGAPTGAAPVADASTGSGTTSGAGEGAVGPSGPAGLSVAEQLSQLDDLRRRGVISRREFAAKKAELLSRM